MDSDSSLVTRVVQDSLPALSHHARSLSELGVRLGAVRGEFVEVWRANIEREPSLARLGGALDLAQAGATSFIDPLGQQELAAMLDGIVRWSHDWRAHGASFADSLCFMGTLRRSLVPFLLREYAAGPELELVFRALDALERALTNVLGAAEIQATQTLLTDGAHQRTVGRLAGGMTRALNHTLAVIVGRSLMLQEQLTDESHRSELREIHRMALAGADSLKRLEMFALERDESAPSRLDVNALVSDVVQLTRFRWRGDAEASGIEIEVAKELGAVPAVIGRRSALSDALVELILNSVEAMPLGGVVTVRTTVVDDRVEITVQDREQEMDAETLARATDPLCTTKKLGRDVAEWTAVKSLVRQTGGSFSLANVPAQGTMATLALPVVQVNQAMPE